MINDIGNKDNVILNDMDESIGFYKDLVALYKDLISEATKNNDTEEIKDLAEQLDEINEFKDYDDLLILSMNNGMGFTCKKYAPCRC